MSDIFLRCRNKLEGGQVSCLRHAISVGLVFLPGFDPDWGLVQIDVLLHKGHQRLIPFHKRCVHRLALPGEI